MKYVILFLYALAMIGIALYSTKKAKSLQDFLLGGRNIGGWMSAFSYGTAYFSAVIFIGYAGRIGWGFGLSAVWIGIGNAIIGSLLPWLIMGPRIRSMTRHMQARTMPEFFEKRYLSRGMKLFAAIIVFIFLVPYSASVYQGVGYLFEQAFNLPFEYCLIGMAVLTAIYLVMGGYLAAVLCDLFQGIIMLGGVVLMIFFVLRSPQVGGLSQALSNLAQIDARLVGPVGPGGLIPLLSLVILTSLGSWGLPQMVHKFYAIRDKAAIRRGAVVSTVFAFIIAGGAYFIGVFGRLFMSAPPVDPVTGVANLDLIIPQIIDVAMPEIMLGVIVVLVLSASMSTLSSLVMASSSVISIDLVKGVICPQMTDKGVKRLMQVFCLLFVALSLLVVVVSNRQATIVALMSFSWGTLSGSFLGPFLWGLLWKRVTKAGAWAGMLSGIITTAVMILIFGAKAQAQAPLIGSIAMIVSLIIVPLVSLLTPRMAAQHIEHVFEVGEAAAE